MGLPAPAPAAAPAEAVTALYQAHALGLIRLVLRFYLDLDEEETAASMRISRGTVKSTTSRALAALGRIPFAYHLLWSGASGQVLIGSIHSAGRDWVGVISGNRFTPLNTPRALGTYEFGTW